MLGLCEAWSHWNITPMLLSCVHQLKPALEYRKEMNKSYASACVGKLKPRHVAPLTFMRAAPGVLRLPTAGRLVQRGASVAAVRPEPAAVRARHALFRRRRVWRWPPAAAAADLPACPMHFIP